jgi:voltage-gated potassium channel
MALLALRPHVVDFFEIAGRGNAAVRLEELQVPAGSQLAGQRLAQVCGAAVPLLIRRGTQLLPNPDRDLTLQAGDVVVLLGEPGALRPLQGA